MAVKKFPKSTDRRYRICVYTVPATKIITQDKRRIKTEDNMYEIKSEQMEQVAGGVDKSFFDRGKTLEEQEAYVHVNFRIAKEMPLSYQYACQLEIRKASRYPLNLLTDAHIRNIGKAVYSEK